MQHMTSAPAMLLQIDVNLIKLDEFTHAERILMVYNIWINKMFEMSRILTKYGENLVEFH